MIIAQMLCFRDNFQFLRVEIPSTARNGAGAGIIMPDMATTARNATTAERATDHDLANTIRALVMDAVEKTKSGRPGMPMGMAEIAVALKTRHLRHDPTNPLPPAIFSRSSAYRRARRRGHPRGRRERGTSNVKE
jgi:hypothetical protein